MNADGTKIYGLGVSSEKRVSLRANCRGGTGVGGGSIHSLLMSSSNGMCMNCVSNFTVLSPGGSTVHRCCAAEGKLYDGFVKYLIRSGQKRV